MRGEGEKGGRKGAKRKNGKVTLAATLFTKGREQRSGGWEMREARGTWREDGVRERGDERRHQAYREHEALERAPRGGGPRRMRGP